LFLIRVCVSQWPLTFPIMHRAAYATRHSMRERIDATHWRADTNTA
jgi:hypothetical protein